MSREFDVKVPNIGDFEGVEIIELLVKPGDVVKVEDPLITLESDKATMDIPSPAAGRVKELKVKVGDKVSEGALILTLDEAEAAKPAPGEPKKSAAAPAPEIPPSAKEKSAAAPAPETQRRAQGKSAAAPSPPAREPGAAAAPGKHREIKVPDIGEFKDVPIIELLVKPGDAVQPESPLVTLESDKASMDIPSPAAGIVREVLVKVGDTVSEGVPIVILEESVPAPAESRQKEKPVPAAACRAADDDAKPVATPPPVQPRPAPAAPWGAQTVAANLSSRAYAGPSVRRFARELGVDLGLVRGSGRKGRILLSDVKSFTKAVMTDNRVFARGGGFSLPEIPPVDFSKFGPVETKAMPRLKRLSAQNVHRSWINVPHVTQFDEADVTELEEFRKSKLEEAKNRGLKLTLLTFLVKAAVVALKKFPDFNSSLTPDGESLVYKKYFHIGFAVNTDQGLMVPVVRDADQRGLFELAKELAGMAEKARAKKIKPPEMQGGCFTISSLGHVGGVGFTPIINTPEVAILGVSRALMKPVYM
ncbi:MAG: dihydrolipoyllysine-residue acetyltransferase, partial [Gammaproteobacteria bacterium]|nr:dihydrolipoyllysine-residue acetyltransferase [Gammaproteobacteria bacterium]